MEQLGSGPSSLCVARVAQGVDTYPVEGLLPGPGGQWHHTPDESALAIGWWFRMPRLMRFDGQLFGRQSAWVTSAKFCKSPGK